MLRFCTAGHGNSLPRQKLGAFVLWAHVWLELPRLALGRCAFAGFCLLGLVTKKSNCVWGAVLAHSLHNLIVIFL